MASGRRGGLGLVPLREVSTLKLNELYPGIT